MENEIVKRPRKKKPSAKKPRTNAAVADLVVTKPSSPFDYEDLVLLAKKIVKESKLKLPKGYGIVVIVADSNSPKPDTWLKVGVSTNATSARHMMAIQEIALHGRAKRAYEDVVDMRDEPLKLERGDGG